MKDNEAAREILQESMFPFLESVACPSGLVESAVESILSMIDETTAAAGTTEEPVGGGAKKLRQGIVNLASAFADQSEEDANLFMWGTGKPIKANANVQIDAYSDKISAKDKRKQRQELEKTRRELAELHHMEQASAKAGVSVMLVPTVKSKERDVNLQGLTLSLNNGTVLLEHGDLKFAYQRRYGLVSERVLNGCGGMVHGEKGKHPIDNISFLCIDWREWSWQDDASKQNCQLARLGGVPSTFTCTSRQTGTSHK